MPYLSLVFLTRLNQGSIPRTSLFRACSRSYDQLHQSLTPSVRVLNLSTQCLPTGPSLRSASRSLAISSTIVLVAPTPSASRSSMRATIASSSMLSSFFDLGSQPRRATFPARRSLSVVQGTTNALDACLVLSGTVPFIAWIARYSVPLLYIVCALRCRGIVVIVCESRDVGEGGRLSGETRYTESNHTYKDPTRYLEYNKEIITNTNFKFSRIGVILAKHIQISYKKSVATTFKACI